MSFFKKLFGTTQADEAKSPTDQRNSLASYQEVPWMNALRLTNIGICLDAGFTPSRSLPVESDRQLRPAVEIAQRLNAIKALVLWLMVPEADLPNVVILDFVHANALEKWMTEEEKSILSASRNDEELRNGIGWKFENAWPLAWFFGFEEPAIDGQMMTGERMQEILLDYSCPLNEKIENWITDIELIAEEKVIELEDLFYCLHNAVRSAQMGRKTVPENFDPIGNGGVIHERRHSLTWMLSAGVEWDDTDLST